jgi:hypothetical protein
MADGAILGVQLAAVCWIAGIVLGEGDLDGGQ